MANTNFPDANHSSNDRVPSPDSENEEVLLSDIIDSESANLILEDVADREAEVGQLIERFKGSGMGRASVTGGDPDDDLYQAEVVGEEAVGGQTPTPDQSVTEELLHAMGISSVDGEPVGTMKKFMKRDRGRWELDPQSSEDYDEHGKS
ncbi:hypothetical protein IQ249_09605 [Lusitaniella coriacea LEGE 07157]|uniref:Uncharacterized protein n=1 Tax=Lusitaniella coriacea LEGE 07157 TaxID=945747 RepID=A0A8J7DWK3_9CYAN|nr:DUF6335 family protein [Lusitaniella coriacea]MBE9116150.1 hypothetical protein [Lusitaniella coriacea LEGE 07157]